MPYKDPAANRLSHRLAQQRRRREVIDWLGGACAECGFTDPRALQVDHVFRDGAHQKKFLGKSRNMAWLYWKSLKEGINIGWQLLCANCHAVKTWEENYVSSE